MNLKPNVRPWLIAALALGWCSWGAAQSGEDSSNAAFFAHFPEDFVHQYPQGTQARQISDVKRILDAQQPTLLAAFTQARAHDPSLQGQMDIALAVAPGGEVVAARTVHSTLRDTQLRSTILATLQQMTFGPATGSGYYLVWYPMVFQQGQEQVAPTTAPSSSMNAPAQPVAPTLAGDARSQEMQQALQAELTPAPSVPGAATKPGSAEWVASIAAAIERQWQRPVNGPVDFQCIVNLEILPTGKIAQASMKQGTQNLALDQSILDAVRRSDPVPMPVDPAVYARDVSIVFRSR